MTPPARAAAVLSSERLVLRLVEARDAAALFALYSNPDIMRYWSHEAWTTPAQAEIAIDEARTEHAAGASLHYVIEQRVSGAVIGSCALYEIGRERGRERRSDSANGAGGETSALLGYMLARQVWGLGYLSEAMRAFLDHAFLVRGIDCVRAQVHPRNVASARLLAKLGFLPEQYEGRAWNVAGTSSLPCGFCLRRRGWLAAALRRDAPRVPGGGRLRES